MIRLENMDVRSMIWVGGQFLMKRNKAPKLPNRGQCDWRKQARFMRKGYKVSVAHLKHVCNALCN